MLYCKKCGTQLEDDAVFCHICGTPVPKTKSSSNKPAEAQPEDFGQTIQREGFVYGVVNLENLPPGHVIDERYEIKAKIGQGGFGAVYRAFDRRMQIDKALKVIPEALTNDVVAMDNLRQEARTMIRLKHPNIVHVYDLHEGEISYIDMEFIDGVSLAEYRISKPEKRLPEEEVKQIALQILDGLAYAHQQNVIHRDIKPQNIMISKDESPNRPKLKIMDFGIAETLRTSMSMIQNTSTTGTLVYMAPEQLRGAGVSKRSDIYALGATLYELLSGKPPFYTGDITYQILHEEPRPLPHVSETMNKILLTCLQKDQSKRFQSCEDMKKALETGKIEIVNSEQRTTHSEQRTVNSGQRTVNSEQRTVYSGQRTVNSEQRTAYSGQRTVKSEQRKGMKKWMFGVAALVLLVMLGVVGVKQGWFAGKTPQPGAVTMEDMKDASWQQLTELEKKRIERLLKKADNLFVDNNLVKPVGNNAYDIYKEVLKIHPGNKYAIAQLGLIKKDFLKRSRLELNNGNFDSAMKITRAGLGYFENDEELLNLQKQIKIKRLENKARQLAQKKHYISPEKTTPMPFARRFCNWMLTMPWPNKF